VDALIGTAMSRKPVKFEVDLLQGRVHVADPAGARTLDIGSPEAFALISRAWLRSGWDAKYVYSFSWLGRPLIQLPDDVLRIQEVVFAVQPDVIIETGVAHGGSLVFYASLAKAMGRGRVIGVDIEIRPQNRTAIEQHFLAPYISLVEGNSVAPDTLDRVRALTKPDERVLVLLDSNHTYEHVMAELKVYAPLVSTGSYIVAMDGIMGEVVGAPRTQPDWTWNNPTQAALAFVKENPAFAIEEPPRVFNEGDIRERVTYWPGAFIKRLR
jgi:cephalosporin hydroxylase